MKELQAKAKVTQTMTRDGLVVENQADGTVENVSSREAEQDYSTDAGGKAEKILERTEDVKDKHKAKKKAKQAAETAESEDGLHRSAARLELTEEERTDPALQPYIQKAGAKADKLDAARAALPKKRVPVKEKVYDAASGKLDSLANDDSLTDDQKKQVKELQKQLSDAQQQEKIERTDWKKQELQAQLDLMSDIQAIADGSERTMPDRSNISRQIQRNRSTARKQESVSLMDLLAEQQEDDFDAR